MRARLFVSSASISFFMLAACGGDAPPPQTQARPFTADTAKPPPPPADAPSSAPYAQLSREELNRRAVLFNVPIFWVADANGNKAVDPSEVRSLLFYPQENSWVEAGKFTALFDTTYRKIVQGDFEPKDATDGDRRQLVIRELDQGRTTLVDNDFSSASNEEKAFVRHMLTVAKMMDGLYAAQAGIGALAAKVPTDDLPSQSMFPRNWGPKCEAPLTEKIRLARRFPDRRSRSSAFIRTRCRRKKTSATCS